MARRAAAVLGVVVVSALLLLVCRGAREASKPRRGGGVLAPELARGERVARVADASLGPLAWLYEPGVPGRRIAGVVVDEAGQGVAGARVELRLAAAPSVELGPGAVAVSGEDGRFDLGVQAVASYELHAGARGLRPVLTDVRADWPQWPTEGLRVVLGACGAPVVGRVVDARSGAGIAGARVGTIVLGRFVRSPLGVVVSDAEGRFEICRAEYLVADAAGYRRRVASIPPGPEPMEVRLEQGRVVRGRVVDEHGEAVEGALVTVELGFLNDVQLLTDGSGEFELPAVDGWPLSVTARHGVAGSGHALVPAGTASPVEVEVRLARVCRRVAGVVINDGRPVSGAGINPHGPSPMAFVDRAAAMSQVDGSFVVPCAPMDAFLIDVIGYRSAATTVPPGREPIDDLVIQVTPMMAIRGRVVGAPADEVTLAVYTLGHLRRRPVLAADGSFEVSGLEPNFYRFEARAKDGRVAVAPDIDLRSLPTSGEVDPVVLVLAPAASVSGRVVDAAGAPQAGALVTLGGPIKRSAWTDAQGAFSITGLASGTYKIGLRDHDLLGEEGSVTVAAGERREIIVHAAAHAPRAAEEEQQAPEATATVRVQVSGCEPPIEIWLGVDGVPSRLQRSFRHTTGSTSAVLGPVPAGEMSVSASCRLGDGGVTVMAEAGAIVDAIIIVEGVGAIGGVVLGPPPEQLHDIVCEIDRTDESGERPHGSWLGESRGVRPSGAFLLSRVAAGDVIVKCESRATAAHDWEGEASVTVRPGETTWIELPMVDVSD